MIAPELLGLSVCFAGGSSFLVVGVVSVFVGMGFISVLGSVGLSTLGFVFFGVLGSLSFRSATEKILLIQSIIHYGQV